eukprot:5803641-Prymnesium_polylepis.1
MLSRLFATDRSSEPAPQPLRRSPSMVAPGHTAEFLSAVAAVQQAKMTPEVAACIRARAEAQRRTEQLRARSHTLQRTATLSHASFAWSPSISAPMS